MLDAVVDEWAEVRGFCFVLFRLFFKSQIQTKMTYKFLNSLHTWGHGCSSPPDIFGRVN